MFGREVAARLSAGGIVPLAAHYRATSLIRRVATISQRRRTILDSRKGALVRAPREPDACVQEIPADIPRAAMRARTVVPAFPSFEQRRNDKPTAKPCTARLISVELSTFCHHAFGARIVYGQ
jgi:hypothetical protein